MVVNDRDRDDEGRDGHDDPFDRDVDIEPRARGAPRVPFGRSLEGAADRAQDRLAHAVKRVHRAHQHGSDGDGPHHVVPHRVTHEVPGGAPARRGRPEARGQVRVDKKDQGNEEQPGDDPARKIDGGEPRSDDVADAHQRGRRGRRGVGDAPRIGHGPDLLLLIAEIADDRLRKTYKERHRILEDLEPFFVFEHLQESAQSQRTENVFGRVCGPLLARFHDLGAGRALRKRQVRRLDAQRPAQNDDEENTQQAARQQDQRPHPEVTAQVLPQPDAPNVHHHEGGNGEDGPGDQGLAHRGGRAREVLLEHSAAKERQPKQRDRDHSGGNRGRDGLAGLHAQVRVGRAKKRRKQDAGHDRLQGKLRLGRIVGDEGLEGR